LHNTVAGYDEIRVVLQHSSIAIEQKRTYTSGRRCELRHDDAFVLIELNHSCTCRQTTTVLRWTIASFVRKVIEPDANGARANVSCPYGVTELKHFVVILSRVEQFGEF
jgi:hypothetical protein